MKRKKEETEKTEGKEGLVRTSRGTEPLRNVTFHLFSHACGYYITVKYLQKDPSGIVREVSDYLGVPESEVRELFWLLFFDIQRNMSTGLIWEFLKAWLRKGGLISEGRSGQD